MIHQTQCYFNHLKRKKEKEVAFTSLDRLESVIVSYSSITHPVLLAFGPAFSWKTKVFLIPITFLVCLVFMGFSWQVDFQNPAFVLLLEHFLFELLSSRGQKKYHASSSDFIIDLSTQT